MDIHYVLKGIIDMEYLKDKVREGIINLSNLPTEVLIEWASETQDQELKDMIGDEIMYR